MVMDGSPHVGFPYAVTGGKAGESFELSVRGHVAWVSGNHAGIAFNRKLEPEQVLRHVPQPRPKMQAEFKRPGFTVRDLSPAQRKQFERWMWSPGPAKPGE